jgi:hypothetical protein
MQKIFTFFIFGLIIFSSCHSKEKKSGNSTIKNAESVQTFFPVTDYLKGQLYELDSMPVTPLKTVTFNGKTDSEWLKRESIRLFAAPFLTPVIDSVSMSPYFSVKSFLDQTINAFTFSYDPIKQLPDSIKLTHWDVYINPQSSKVERIYLVKENTENGINTTTQLTWKSGQGCTIITITQKPGKEPLIKEEKMKWNFDN